MLTICLKVAPTIGAITLPYSASSLHRLPAPLSPSCDKPEIQNKIFLFLCLKFLLRLNAKYRNKNFRNQLCFFRYISQWLKTKYIPNLFVFISVVVAIQKEMRPGYIFFWILQQHQTKKKEFGICCLVTGCCNERNQRW